jgi:hypothetical protein
VSFNTSASAEKLGSNLGPLAAEYRGETGWNTQNKPKRDNRLVNRLLVRDQGVGGSNPLSPTKLFIINSLDYSIEQILAEEFASLQKIESFVFNVLTLDS